MDDGLDLVEVETVRPDALGAQPERLVEHIVRNTGGRHDQSQGSGASRQQWSNVPVDPILGQDKLASYIGKEPQ